ncbi:alpha-ketoglutarate-dependent dioxygenase AlkB family protein [Neptunomonas antarctica]|uniref:DNA-N1-methyladenine dioxygenase n=1 Tax=Neptunomonas antarctica TaxID=619304 RepID=A0A1N7M1A3_9GAMM|nr:alpha-ketoglutarate-dependent dioxygenase AlkB [Neptunomonas antarctica]SIS79868.1 DNA-N1-methyladenine dioxygenase [Neptunomonas antarctica]
MTDNQFQLSTQPGIQSKTQSQTITAPQTELILYPEFLCASESLAIQSQLSAEIHWRQDSIQVYGKTHQIPRLQSFQGEPGIRYQYSNLVLETKLWHPLVLSLKTRIEQHCQHLFNSVLINRYRNGQDKMGWHSDDEPELGTNPVIASLSFGTERRFILRHRWDKQRPKIELNLGQGTLLLMAGQTQHYWQHTVPSSRRVQEERINLTFRYVYP